MHECTYGCVNKINIEDHTILRQKTKRNILVIHSYVNKIKYELKELQTSKDAFHAQK
jgi:hypothetical protein